MQHLIISRINLEMDLDEFKYKDPQPWKRKGYNESRIELLNSWCRPSLEKQTNQNFTFISLWNIGTKDSSEIENEIKIEIQRTGERDDEPLDYEALLRDIDGKKTLNYADQIARKVSEIFKPPVLITNLDCDDCLHKNFVETLQRVVRDRDLDRSKPFYFSTSNRFCYNVETGAKGMKKTSAPSPFVSTWEPEIKCYPLRYNHSYLQKWVPGINVEGLLGMQTVNGTNMFSEGTGQSAEFNVSDYA